MSDSTVPARRLGLQRASREVAPSCFRTIALIAVTEDPVVLEMPAFDSTYVSLMVTDYDH